MARNYAYGHSHFLEDCGVQQGHVGALGNTAAGAYKDASVTFPKPYASAPVVVVGFETASTAGTFGRCSVAVVSATATGFTLRFFNGDSSNRNPGFTWIAAGKVV